MNDLKIKLTLGAFNVEIEGASEDVISEFNALKTNGLGQMVDQLVPLFNQGKPYPSDVVKNDNEEKLLLTDSNPASPNAVTSPDGQTLHDVVFKMLPKTESEWILVYGHFIGLDGKRTFTRDEIVGKYEDSKRKDTNAMKNLSASVKGAVKKGWISALNDREFIVTPPGIAQLKEIFSRTEASVRVPRKMIKKDAAQSDAETKSNQSKKTAAKSKGSENYKPIQTINFHPEGKQSLEEFFLSKMTDKKSGSQMEICLVFAYYLQKILELKNISPAHIYTCYIEVKISCPTALKQVLANTATRKGWLDVSNINDISVPISGENEVNYKLPRSKSNTSEGKK